MAIASVPVVGFGFRSASHRHRGPSRMAADTHVPADASASLVLAIVITSTTPILLLDRDLRIVAASTSFCSAFDIDPAIIPGRLLSELGTGEWDVPQLISGLTSAISG